jgi:hypothetical protein
MLPLCSDMIALLRHFSTEAHQSARGLSLRQEWSEDYIIVIFRAWHRIIHIISEKRRLASERDRPVIGKLKTITHELAREWSHFLSVWLGGPDGIGASIFIISYGRSFGSPIFLTLVFKER